MKKFYSSLLRLSANICACLGLVSLLSAYAAIMEWERISNLINPMAIASMILVFPLFIAFVLIGLVSSKNELGKKSLKNKNFGRLIKDSLNDFFEPIKILLNIQKTHLTVCLFLLLSGAYMYKTHQIGGVNWTFGTPFEREHAISFGATASIFYAIMLPFYSHKSAKDALFDNES